ITNEIGEIDSIAVDETLRHLGIGQRLMEIILNIFKERGIKICSLEVSTTNEAAIFFHKNIGFKIEKTLENYYEDGANAYLMHLEIKPATGRRRACEHMNMALLMIDESFTDNGEKKAARKDLCQVLKEK